MTLKKGDKVTIPGEFEVTYASLDGLVTIVSDKIQGWRPSVPASILRKVQPTLIPNDLWIDSEGRVWLIRPPARDDDGLRAWHVTPSVGGWGETTWENSDVTKNQAPFPDFVERLYPKP